MNGISLPKVATSHDIPPTQRPIKDDCTRAFHGMHLGVTFPCHSKFLGRNQHSARDKGAYTLPASEPPSIRLGCDGLQGDLVLLQQLVANKNSWDIISYANHMQTVATSDNRVPR